MLRFILLGISIGFLFINANSQCVGSSFQKIYGGTGNDRAHSIINTQDGGYAVVGETNSFGAGLNDFFLLKLDSSGNHMWSKTYGGSSIEDGANIGIIQTVNGDYILHGYTKSFGALGAFDSYIIRLDNLGNIKWEKRVNGADDESFRDVFELSNGDLIVSGNSNSISTLGDHDYHVMKLDSLGNSIWSKTYGGNAQNSGFDQSVGLIVDALDNLYVSGVTDSYGVGTLEGFMIKLTTNGDIVWEKVIGGSSYDFLYNSIILNDGNILTVGGTDFGAGNRDLMLVKLDTAGSIIWSKTYGGAQDDYGVNLKQKNNNEIFICGNTASFGNGLQVLLMNIDSLGGINWSNTYGSSSTDEVEKWGMPMTLTQDGGAILVGTTNGFGASGQDLYIVRTNSCGESFCNDQQISLTVNNPIISIANTNVTTLTGLGLVNTNTLLSNFNYNTTTMCDSVWDGCSIPVIISSITSDTIICQGQNFQISANATGGSGSGYTYFWDNGLGAGQNQNVSPSVNTVYSVYATDIINCMSDTANVQISLYPFISVAAGTTDTICEGGIMPITSIAIGGNGGPFTYTWDNGLGVGQNKLVSPSTTTIYKVTVDDGCTVPPGIDSVTIYVEICTEVETQAFEELIRIYPNPASSKLTIQSGLKIDYIRIYNSLGEQVYNKEIKANLHSLNIYNYNEGMYFIEVQSGEEISRRKVLFTH